MPIKTGQATIGIMFIAAGVLLWLDRAGLIEMHGIWRLWPGVFLMGLGIARLFDPRAGARGGPWLILVGAWLMLNQLAVLRWRDSWPVLLIAAGLGMVWDVRMRRRLPPADGGAGRDA